MRDCPSEACKEASSTSSGRDSGRQAAADLDTFSSAYPTPFLRPMWPFIAGGSLTLFGIWKMQNAALACTSSSLTPIQTLQSLPDRLEQPLNTRMTPETQMVCVCAEELAKCRLGHTMPDTMLIAWVCDSYASQEALES